MSDEFEIAWFADRFFEVMEALKNIQKEITQMAISQQQFDTDLGKQGGDLATLLDLVNQLIAKVTTGGTVDLSSEDTAINSQDSSIQTSIAAAKTALGQ